MDVYQLWFDTAEGFRDVDIVEGVDGFMSHLQERGVIEGSRLLRKKLGLGAGEEWQLLIEVRDLAQLDEAFGHAAGRHGEVEHLHHGINGKVRNFRAALYRDFPDALRSWGAERF